MSIPSAETLKTAFDGMFAMVNGVLMVNPYKLEVLPGYNAKKPFDPKTNETDARLLKMITHNRFDPTMPILVGVNAGEKKAYVLRGHSRVAIAKILRDQKHPNAPVRIACTLIDPADWSEARLQADVSHSNFVRGQDAGELGLTILRMVEAGENKAEIMASLGIDRKKYDACVRLAKADDELKDMIKSGFVRQTLVRKLIETHGEAGAKAVLKTAKARGAKKATGTTIAGAEKSVTGGTAVSDRESGKAGTGAGSGRVPRQTGQSAAVAPASASAPPAKPVLDNGTVAYLEGPFKVGTHGDVCDVKGNGLASCDGAPMARAIVDALNAAHRAGLIAVPGKPKAGNVVPMLPPGKPMAAAAARQHAPRKAGKAH